MSTGANFIRAVLQIERSINGPYMSSALLNYFHKNTKGSLPCYIVSKT